MFLFFYIGSETQSLAIRIEDIRKFFVNRVLRRIFKAKRYDVTKWRKLDSEHIINLYFSPNITRTVKSRMMR